MDIYLTNTTIYTYSIKYPELRIELVLNNNITESEAEVQLLKSLVQAEMDYEQFKCIQPDINRNPVKFEIQRDKPTLNTIRRWIRQYRNQLLKDSDFSMLPDATVISKTSWQTYRQQLRDLPKTWNLDDKPSIDLSSIYSYDDVATLPFPKPPE